MMNEERVEVELKKMWDDSYPEHSDDVKMASWEKFQSEIILFTKAKKKKASIFDYHKKSL